MNVEDDSSNLNNNFNLVPTTCNCTLCAFSIHRRSTRMSAFTPAVQAFENQKFLASSHARNIRILCEHEETKHRLEVSGVKATVLIFGSARAKSSEQYSQMLGSLQESLVKCETDGDLVGAREFELSIERLKAGEWMCAYFDKVFELAREIAKWSTSFQAADDSRSCGLLTLKSPSMENLMATAELKDTQTSRPHPTTENKSRGLKAESLVICTGGGPGFMVRMLHFHLASSHVDAPCISYFSSHFSFLTNLLNKKFNLTRKLLTKERPLFLGQGRWEWASHSPSKMDSTRS